MILDKEDGGNFYFGQFLDNTYDSTPADLLCEADTLQLTVKPCLYVWLQEKEAYFGNFKEGCQHGFGTLYKLSGNISRVIGYLT